MILKPKKGPDAVEPKSPPTDGWSGPWGEINSASETCDVIRFCQGTAGRHQKTHSYPYRVISVWRWSDGPDIEELLIEASADLVTVRGRGLDRVVEAMETGTLALLAEVSGEMPIEASNIWVSRITVQQRPE